jgi:integrase
MVEWPNRALFAEQFIARVKKAREAEFSAEEMEILLGLPKGAYLQFETKSLLPHHLMLRFCLFTGVDPVELLGGYIGALRPKSGNGSSEK